MPAPIVGRETARSAFGRYETLSLVGYFQQIVLQVVDQVPVPRGRQSCRADGSDLYLKDTRLFYLYVQKNVEPLYMSVRSYLSRVCLFHSCAPGPLHPTRLL